MVSKIRPCTDLSHSCAQTFNLQSGLCATCKKIDFVSLTSKTCKKDDDGRHFHIDPLQHVTRKTTCPGCRLILSVARSMDDRQAILDKITITIRRQFILAYYLNPIHSLPVNKYISDKNATAICCPHMESYMEVIFNNFNGQDETPGESTVVGTIIRTEEAEPADSTSVESTILESEDPVFRGRNVLPKVNVDLIKQWMQSCNFQHNGCRLPALEAFREQNIRLIDVQEYRIILATMVEKYVTLSYVWGPATKPLLTQATLSQYSSPDGLKGLKLPRTISDAMQVVKYLGKRYLWVDSLCIVQDNDNDKEQQLSIMDSIYSNAELVVVAAAGGDANTGLPGIGSSPRRIPQRVEKIDGMQFITAQASVQQVLKRSIWNSRGWTFQEVALSRRALVFTESLVYWSCQVGTWREDMSTESSVVALSLNETNSIFPHLYKTGMHTMCRTAMYCQLAETFSQRSFTEERDVLWGFIGVLRLQTSRFRKGFLWSLPYERLDAALLWSDRSGCINVHSRHACHSVIRKGNLYNLPYPSWSWLSTNMSISFMNPCGDLVVSEVTWHEPLKLKDKKSAAYQESISLKDIAADHENKLNTSLLVKSSSELDLMDYGLLHFTAQTAVLTLKRAEESSDDRVASKAWTLRGGMGALIYPTLKRLSGAMFALAMSCMLGGAIPLSGDLAACTDNAAQIPVPVHAAESPDEGIADGDKADKHKDEKDETQSSTNHWVLASIHSLEGEQIGMLEVPILFFNKKSERSGEFVLLSSNAEKESDGRCKEVSEGLDCDTIRHVNGCRHIQSRNIMLIESDGDIAYRRALGKVGKKDWKHVKTQSKTIILG